MKIIVDENIPLGKEAFENIGEVELCAGRAIDSSVVKNADALVVRSITKVNKELLENSSIKFVGTATIGTDHIDQNYLAENNIAFASAAGCNSYSVTEYVFSAITYFAEKYNFDISEKSIGVVGYGNIGTKIIKVADALGMTSVINDPPLERETNQNIFSSLEDALKCDIVTFHVPLNKDGIDKTVHLLNEKNINLIKDGAILINASRGPVISGDILKNKLLKNKNIHTVLDVWETEPNFDSELFKLVEIGTPHIAGYSFEGKVNGTTMIYEALSDFIKSPKTWKPNLDKVEDNVVVIEDNETTLSVLKKLFNKSYNVIDDDTKMRKCVDFTEEKRAEFFDLLRKNYRKRRELNNFEVIMSFENDKLRNLLNVLRVKQIAR
jgi:erythronate-4-phosphate dehydrogenase